MPEEELTGAIPADGYYAVRERAREDGIRIRGPEVPHENIVVFMSTGKTFTFRNCIDIVDNENCISFTYIAMSDDRAKRATFYKYDGAVAGVSRFY